MKHVQVILDNSSLRFEKATSVYRIKNLLVVEYINESNEEVAQAVEFSTVQKLFVGSRRILKDKVVDRENPEVFPEED